MTLSTSSEITTIRKSSTEDSSSKWEDNKNKSSRIGPVLEPCLDNSEDPISHITIKINPDNLEVKDPKVKKLKDKPKSKLPKKNQSLRQKLKLK